MDPMQDASTVERALLRSAASRLAPVSGSLELTPLCNMNCGMCYVRLSREELERQGRLRSAEEWLSLGRELQKSGVLFLLLTGGEPLLHPGFREIFPGLRQMGMILTVNTNGTLIDEDWADFFAAQKPRRVNITLYGADDRAYEALCRHPGGFDRVCRAVRLLRERDVDVKLSASLTKINRDDLNRLHDVADSLGVPLRTDTYMMPAVRERGRPFSEQTRLAPEDAAAARITALRREMGPELFRSFREKTLWEVGHILPDPPEQSRMACLAGSCSFTVNWQGELRPCVVLTQPAVPVFGLGFEAAWRHLKDEISAIRLSARCAACKLRPICRTCAASALLETGSFDGTPDYMCRFAAESLRLLQEETDG